MLIIDRTQRTWATLSAVVCVVAGAVYFAYASWSVNGPTGGSVPGLIFGLIAAAMMVFAGLLGARRRFPAARIGSAQFWMKGHLWIGTLTVPFALFHAGFGLGGRVEILLWILFFGVILSGFWGLLLQQLLPRMMFENLPRETFIEQIPHLCDRFTAESDCLLAEVCGPLEVTLTPLEMKRFESHWKPHFEDDRKKNRNDYPKTASEAAHFEKFLTKVYAGLPASTAVKATESPTAPASVTPPVMKSVAQVKAPEPVATAPAATDAPAAKPKPDPKALLAAMKAKAAAAAPAVAAEIAAQESATTAPAAAPAKPDPRAMLAAAKAKKALESAEPTSAATSESPAPSPPAVAADAAPAKPDPKALLAAARAKKAAAEAASTGEIAATEPAAEVPVAAAPAKPDPKAMLAAAKAKKAQESAGGTAPAPADAPSMPEASPPASSETAAAPAKPDPKALLAAARAKKAAAEVAATAPPADLSPEHTAMPAAAVADTPPVPSAAKPKADPRAMLAAAKAKKEAAAAGGAPSAPVAEPAAAAPTPPISDPAPAATGKPDPKAMMAALKAKKEAAAQQAAPAGAAPAAAPAAKANPLAQLKAVKEPAAAAQPDLVAAAKVAPPSPTQIKELKLFYLELIRPQLPLQPATQEWREAIRRSIMVCRIRSDNQHPQFLPIFDNLHDLCEQRQQFAMIQRFHFWLHGWLLVHIPVTVALYVVLVVHAVMALRVIPFGN